MYQALHKNKIINSFQNTYVEYQYLYMAVLYNKSVY